MKVDEVVSETWTEVTYREQAKGPNKSVPTPLVVEVRRAGAKPEERDLVAAMGELERGNVTDALRQLKALAGGGYRQNLESGKLEFVPFSVNDPPVRTKRPPWASEYAHFFYAKALYLDGLARKDKEILEQARLALVDEPIPGGDGKATTGGFLGRFAGGNSRYLPEAMLLKAEVLVALEKYPEAAQAYEDLGKQAISVDIGSRWAYEAKRGIGRIAEAQGKSQEAISAYEDAAEYMKILLGRRSAPARSRRWGAGTAAAARRPPG